MSLSINGSFNGSINSSFNGNFNGSLKCHIASRWVHG